MILKRFMMQRKFIAVSLSSPPYLPDYPHKYGSEGGCADHSVFDKMRKYQASAVEEQTKVCTDKDPSLPPLPPRPELNTQMDEAHEIINI